MKSYIVVTKRIRIGIIHVAPNNIKVLYFEKSADDLVNGIVEEMDEVLEEVSKGVDDRTRETLDKCGFVHLNDDVTTYNFFFFFF